MSNAAQSQRLSTNLVFNLLYRVSTVVIPLITTPYISRVLGSENSGIYNYTYTIATYFVIIGCFGFENYGNRQIAKVRDDQDKLNQVFSSIFGLQMIMCTIAMILYILYLFLINRVFPDYMRICALYVLATYFNVTWVYYGLERFKSTAIRSILIRLAGLILIFTMVKSKNDLEKYISILAVLEVINQVVLWGRVFRYVKFVRVGFEKIVSHVKGCTLLFFPILLFNIYTLMDKNMLGLFSTMQETGYYSYAFKIVEIPFHFISAIGIVMLPRMTNLVAKGKEKESRVYIERTFRYNTIASVAMTFGLIGVREDLAVGFLGSEYMRCADLICVMAPMIIVRAWANVIRTQYLMPNSMDVPYVGSMFVGVIVNFILNFLLIRTMGAYGAALATLVTESVVAIIQIIVVINKLPVLRYLTKNSPFIIFGVIMLGAVRCVHYFFHGTLLALALQVATGVVVFLGLCAFYLIKVNSPFIDIIKRKLGPKNVIGRG